MLSKGENEGAHANSWPTKKNDDTRSGPVFKGRRRDFPDPRGWISGGALSPSRWISFLDAQLTSAVMPHGRRRQRRKGGKK